MDDRIELHWTPELRDWIEASWQLSRIRLVIIALFLASGGLIELALHQVWLGVVMFVLGPTVVALQLFLSALSFRRSTMVRGEHRAVVAEDGLRVTSCGSTAEFAWPMFAEWREVSRVFVLRTGGVRALSMVMLPKRALTGDRTSALRQTLADQVGPAGTRRPVPLTPAPATKAAAGRVSPRSLAGYDEPISLHWTPTRADWVVALRAVSWIYWLFPVLAVIFVVGGIVQSAMSYTTTPGGGHSFSLAVVFLAPVGVFLGCMPSMRVRGLFHRNPLLAAEQRVRVDEAGLHFTIAGAQSSTGWDVYVTFKERRRVFVLRHGKSTLTPVTVLAKRGVVAPRTVDDVRAMLERRVSATKR